MDYKYQIEKIAATRAQKMVNAGKLSKKTLNRLFEEGKVVNNVNNRINARTKRMAGGVAPKKLNAKNFKRISNVDNLKSRAVIDTRRVMKHQGKQNEKVVAELRRKTGGNVKINRDIKNILDGRTGVSWGIRSGDILDMNMSIPNAKAKEMFLSPKANKEIRALTARHEISGEAVSQANKIEGLNRKGYPLENSVINSMEINNHASPDVLFGDAKFIKKLSPEAQDRFYRKNRHNITEFRHPDFKKNKKMNESEAMNTLILKGKDVKKNAKNIKDVRYFDRKNVSEEERKRAFKTVMRTKLDVDPDIREGIIEDMYNGYKNTDFFKTWKGDRSKINGQSRRIKKKPLATGDRYIPGSGKNKKIPYFDNSNPVKSTSNEPIGKSNFIDKAKKIAPGTITLGGIAYGGKKLYDKRKKGRKDVIHNE